MAALTPEARKEAARKAVATRKARLAANGGVKAPAPSAPAEQPSAEAPAEPAKVVKARPANAVGCSLCERAEDRGEHVVYWPCRECGGHFCEHKVNVATMRVSGSALCIPCGWRENRVVIFNAKLARLGLSPLPLKPEPEMLEAA